MKKESILHTILMGLTGILILVSGIYFHEPFILMFPLFVSLAVMTLQSNVNRWGYFLGGMNCIIYTAVLLYLGLYASAASTLLVSCPMQLITFFNWRKNAFKQAVVFKKLTAKQWILGFLAICVAYIVLYILLTAVNSNVVVLESINTVIGLAVTLLTMRAYKEYVYLWPVSGVLSVLMNIRVVALDIRQFPHLIYSVFSLYCILRAIPRVLALYKQQQAENVQQAEI